MDPASMFSAFHSKRVDADEAWKAFLNQFSHLFLKIIWRFERDHDAVMEKYLFVCSKLAANDFAILRKYDISFVERSTTLTSWLAAVVNNLCIDEHRKRAGRKRYPRGLLRLSDFDRKVFRLWVWKSLAPEEILLQLAPETNGSADKVVSSMSRIEDVLGAKMATTTGEVLDHPRETEDIPDTADPEEEWVEWLEWVENQVSALPEHERLVIRLRFWEGMSVRDIARVLMHENENRVYTILHTILRKLRKNVSTKTEA